MDELLTDHGSDSGCGYGYGYGCGDGNGSGCGDCCEGHCGYGHSYNCFEEALSGYGCGYSLGYGYGGGDGFGYGYGFGCGGGNGENIVYGCSSRLSSRYTQLSLSGDGGSYAHGYGVALGFLSKYIVELIRPWNIIKIGCIVMSIDEWKREWRSIAIENNINVDDSTVESILVKALGLIGD